MRAETRFVRVRTREGPLEGRVVPVRTKEGAKELTSLAFPTRRVTKELTFLAFPTRRVTKESTFLAFPTRRVTKESTFLAFPTRRGGKGTEIDENEPSGERINLRPVATKPREVDLKPRFERVKLETDVMEVGMGRLKSFADDDRLEVRAKKPREVRDKPDEARAKPVAEAHRFSIEGVRPTDRRVARHR